MGVNVGDEEPPRVATVSGTTGASVGSSTDEGMKEREEATQLVTRERSSAEKNKQVEPAPPRGAKRKAEATKRRVGRMRDKEDDTPSAEEDATLTKKRKVSSPTKQPPCTGSEVKKLQEIMVEGIKCWRETQDSYDEYNKRIAKDHPSWPRPTLNACRGALKRACEWGYKPSSGRRKKCHWRRTCTISRSQGGRFEMRSTASPENLGEFVRSGR
jgi:hypothetical protein